MRLGFGMKQIEPFPWRAPRRGTTSSRAVDRTGKPLRSTMCGIFGIIDLAGRRPIPATVLKRASDAMFHRGPDEEGFLRQPGFGFAARRLSIVGLSDGQQPAFNETKTVSVIFNGEIFDHDDLASRSQGSRPPSHHVVRHRGSPPPVGRIRRKTCSPSSTASLPWRCSMNESRNSF